MPHLQGVMRDAALPFPPTLDELIAPENPVRLIDAFVDQLDLIALKFQHAPAQVEGRPAYPPAALLKLYLYGYTNGIRSSRKLERETQRNLEVIWLIQYLRPDHKTIANFRRDNLEPLQAVGREFTQWCRQLDLFGGELVAIDGSKFQAVNSRNRNFTATKLSRALQLLERQIKTYLTVLDEQDTQEAGILEPAVAQAMQKLTRLHERQAHYQTLQAALTASGETQLSLTDPDSRAMPTGHTTTVAYNAQIAVDAKHHLIAAHEVTSVTHDHSALARMARAAKQTLQVDHLDALADQGYYDGDEIAACLAEHITPWITRPITSANRKYGLFTKDDFDYDRARDLYRCPAGAVLPRTSTTIEKGRAMHRYRAPLATCRACSLRSRCNRSTQDGRRLSRLVNEHVLDDMARRVQQHPERMRLRKQLAEHPFGTLKRALHQGYFLMRRLPKVSTEMSLSVWAYNFKRAVAILGVPALLAAVGRVYSPWICARRAYGRPRPLMPACSQRVLTQSGAPSGRRSA